MKTYIATPETDSNGNFIYDQVKFLKKGVQWLEDYRKWMRDGYSGYDPEAARKAFGDGGWTWAAGSMPIADITETSYAEFSFNEKAAGCFGDSLRDVVTQIVLPDMERGEASSRLFLILPIYEFDADNVKPGVHIFMNNDGFKMVTEDFIRKYVDCGLTGLQFSDPSVPFWKR